MVPKKALTTKVRTLQTSDGRDSSIQLIKAK